MTAAKGPMQALGGWVKASLGADGWTPIDVLERWIGGSSAPTWGGSILLTDGKIHVIMGDGCPCGVPT